MENPSTVREQVVAAVLGAPQPASPLPEPKQDKDRNEPKAFGNSKHFGANHHSRGKSKKAVKAAKRSRKINRRK